MSNLKKIVIGTCLPGFFLVGGGGWGTGGIPPLPGKLACPHINLPPKCWFYKFYAVFGHFVQIVTPQVDPIWEALFTIMDPGKWKN